MHPTSPLNPLLPQPNTAPNTLPAFSGGMALDRLQLQQPSLAFQPPQPGAGIDPTQVMLMQNQMLTSMMQILLMLMLNRLEGQTGAANGQDAGQLSGASGTAGGSSASDGGSASSSSGGASSSANSGPASPGAQGMLDRAHGMLGLNEDRNTAEIQKVTGKSGINPSTTPWCAAFAINLMKEHGVLDTEGLSNPNYCPTIKSWAQKKGIWAGRGHTPKPGDAILFDWQKDGTSDHIGIVEKVENGKIITIEGNSSDSVKRNTYELNSPKIDGFVQSKG